MAKLLNVSLWIVQVLLAALFLFSGVFKLITPPEVLAAQSGAFSVLFIQFIGVCEILGALGLLLPGIFKFKPVLTPLAALGLLIIMVGAVVVTITTMAVSFAIMPFVVGLLSAFVAYGRWKLHPLNFKNAKKK